MRRPNDAYYTHSSLTQALVERVPIAGRVCEPCVGDGHIARALWQYCQADIDRITTADINPDKRFFPPHHYSEDVTRTGAKVWQGQYDWVVTNPPFGVAAAILPLAWTAARVGVAFLLRLSFQEPARDRAQWLLEHRQHYAHQIIFNPRPSFTDDGKTDSVTVAWMVWTKQEPAGCITDYVTDWRR